MSDVELKLEQASKLLSMGKLPKKSENFVNSLKRKKSIRRLTKRQYEWLSQIVQQYNEVSIFRGIKDEAEPDPKLKVYDIKQSEKSDDWFNNL